MICSAKITAGIGKTSIVLGEFSHTTIQTLEEIIEACAYGNEIYTYRIDLQFQKDQRRIDTCGG